VTDAASLLKHLATGRHQAAEGSRAGAGFPLFVRVKGQGTHTGEPPAQGSVGRIFDDSGRDLQRLVSNIAPREKQLLRVVSTPHAGQLRSSRNRSPACVSSWDRPPSTWSTQHSREMLKSIALA